jgi:hypothetical protein
MIEQKRSVDQLMTIIKGDPNAITELRNDPISALEKFVDKAKAETPVYYQDKWVYRLVVSALGMIILVAGVGAIILVASDKTTPEILIALGSAAVGALAGLLAPSPGGK